MSVEHVFVLMSGRAEPVQYVFVNVWLFVLKKIPDWCISVRIFQCHISSHIHFCVCICMCQTVMLVCKHNTKHLTMTSFEQRLLMVIFKGRKRPCFLCTSPPLVLLLLEVLPCLHYADGCGRHAGQRRGRWSTGFKTKGTHSADWWVMGNGFFYNGSCC